MIGGVWGYVVLAVLAAGIIGGGIYKIDGAGYDRCQAEHTSAAAAAKEDSRGKIVEAGKNYEPIKEYIYIQPGADDPVSAPIAAALDRMPGPGDGSGKRQEQ